MAPDAPRANALSWTDALYAYRERGTPHPSVQAVKSGFYHRVSGVEVWEWVATGRIAWIEPRGSWGVVRDKMPGWRWFE